MEQCNGANTARSRPIIRSGLEKHHLSASAEDVVAFTNRTAHSPPWEGWSIGNLAKALVNGHSYIPSLLESVAKQLWQYYRPIVDGHYFSYVDEFTLIDTEGQRTRALYMTTPTYAVNMRELDNQSLAELLQGPRKLALDMASKIERYGVNVGERVYGAGNYILAGQCLPLKVQMVVENGGLLAKYETTMCGYSFPR
jgi:hypothetical protein